MDFPKSVLAERSGYRYRLVWLKPSPHEPDSVDVGIAPTPRASLTRAGGLWADDNDARASKEMRPKCLLIQMTNAASTTSVTQAAPGGYIGINSNEAQIRTHG